MMGLVCVLAAWRGGECSEAPDTNGGHLARLTAVRPGETCTGGEAYNEIVEQLDESPTFITLKQPCLCLLRAF